MSSVLFGACLRYLLRLRPCALALSNRSPDYYVAAAWLSTPIYELVLYHGLSSKRQHF